jgi:hypothetical protein
MPRLVHAVPKYHKHRASGQAALTINGKDYYLGLYGSKASKVEYDRLIAEYLASDRSSSFGAVHKRSPSLSCWRTMSSLRPLTTARIPEASN